MRKLYKAGSWVQPAKSIREAYEKITDRIISYNKGLKHYHYPLIYPYDVEQVYTPFKAEKRIVTGDDFNEYCEELLNDWLWDLSVKSHPQYCREPKEDDYFDDTPPTFFYTNKGQNMVDRAMSRLRKVGEKYFDEFEIEIQTSMYREY